MIRSLSPKQWLLIIFFLLLASYALFQARFLILGPRLTILSPTDGAAVTTVIEVEGTATNVAWLTLDDRQIFTDEKGHFKEKLIVGKGTSIISVRARDRFGREREKSVTVFNNQP
jgi:hypothetical protein